MASNRGGKSLPPLRNGVGAAGVREERELAALEEGDPVAPAACAGQFLLGVLDLHLHRVGIHHVTLAFASGRASLLRHISTNRAGLGEKRLPVALSPQAGQFLLVVLDHDLQPVRIHRLPLSACPGCLLGRSVASPRPVRHRCRSVRCLKDRVSSHMPHRRFVLFQTCPSVQSLSSIGLSRRLGHGMRSLPTARLEG